jgi:LacI family transcriptional regulator
LRILLEETSDPDMIPRQTVFLPELVVRASTAPPPR